MQTLQALRAGLARMLKSVVRAIVAAVVLIAALPLVGGALLYTYRSQVPGSAGAPTIALAPATILFAILPVVVLFLVVYVAVRLAVRHERNRGTAG